MADYRTRKLNDRYNTGRPNVFNAGVELAGYDGGAADVFDDVMFEDAKGGFGLEFDIPALDMPDIADGGSMFDAGGTFGIGGAVDTGLSLGNSLLEGLNQYGKYKYNKEATKYAGKQNQLADQALADNKRKLASDAGFDAGWNVG